MTFIDESGPLGYDFRKKSMGYVFYTYGTRREGEDGLVRFKKGAKGADALILALSLTSLYPAVSRAGGAKDTERIIETEERKRAKASEDAVVYGLGNYVIGEDILPGRHAVFTEDTSEHNAYSICTITLYRDDTDTRHVGTFQFQHHGLISLYREQHLVITKGYTVETDRAGIALGTTGIYKTGRDMEPEAYRITPLTSGSGYYVLYDDMRYYYDCINEYAALFEPITVNIANDQYLRFSDAGSIERVPD